MWIDMHNHYTYYSTGETVRGYTDKMWILIMCIWILSNWRRGWPVLYKLSQLGRRAYVLVKLGKHLSKLKANGGGQSKNTERRYYSKHCISKCSRAVGMVISWTWRLRKFHAPKRLHSPGLLWYDISPSECHPTNINKNLKLFLCGFQWIVPEMWE